jgi:hypothetical protein
MSVLIGTGAVARLLHLSEPQLNDQIRKGRVRALPPVVAGRRLWSIRLIRDVAVDLGIELDDSDLARLARGEEESFHEASP